MYGTHADAIAWLERQLSELETWRMDLMRDGACESCRLEQIDLHRSWLEAQIAQLAPPNFGPTT